MSGATSRNPIRVVVINTQYIETDARSFKSVVQSLTGKDSEVVVAAAKPPPFSAVAGGGSALSRGVSFRDLDRLLMELPTLDELYRLCSD